jgi:hypothetical protein
MALNSQPILRKGGGKGSDPTAGRDDRRERAAWLDAWEWSGKWIKGKEKDGGKGYDPGKGKEKDGKRQHRGKGQLMRAQAQKDGKAKGKEGVAGPQPKGNDQGKLEEKDFKIKYMCTVGVVDTNSASDRRTMSSPAEAMQWSTSAVVSTGSDLPPVFLLPALELWGGLSAGAACSSGAACHSTDEQ